MLEKDTLTYLGPEKFAARRQELVQKKAQKEVSIDQAALVVRDKHLETVNALCRRALAFDMVKACGYHIMNQYHAELFDHLHQPPPPGYSAVSLTQILRADCAAFLWMTRTFDNSET